MSIVRIVVIWLAVFTLGFFTYKLCWSYELAKSETSKSLSLSPDNSRALLEKNLKITYSQETQAETPNLLPDLQKILRKDPINDDVFLIFALLDFNSTGQWNREDALHLALQRNPRNRNVLKALIQLNIGQGKFAETLDNLDLLMTLKWQEADDFFPILAALYSNKKGKNETLKKLQQNPDWKYRYVNYSVNSSNKRNILSILPLVETIKGNQDTAEALTKIRTRYLTKIVNFGYPEKAYELWNTWNDRAQYSILDNLVIDSNFTDNSLLPPFNWVMFNNENVNSSRSHSDGLFASFKDSRPRRIIRQVIPVKNTGEGVITTQANWNYNDRQGFFEWRVYCTRNRKLLSRFAMDNNTKNLPVLSFIIKTNKETCDYIDLELWGIPGAISTRNSILVQSIDLKTSEKFSPE